MTVNILAKLFEHNNWANLQIINACSALSDHQLDDKSTSASTWCLRDALIHMVECQRGYLAILTLPLGEREQQPMEFAQLKDAAIDSGKGLLSLTQEQAADKLVNQLHTSDGYIVEPWVVMVQVINHGHDHRRQIHSIMQALGLTPPNVDGWSFGEAEHTCTQVTD